MQVRVLGKRSVGQFLFYFHHRTLLEQLVYILLELGHLVFILQVENHTLKRQIVLCITIRINRWWEVLRLLISWLWCGLLNRLLYRWSLGGLRYTAARFYFVAPNGRHAFKLSIHIRPRTPF